MERADWPDLHDMFEARDVKTWQRRFPVGFLVRACALSFFIHQHFSRLFCFYRKQGWGLLKLRSLISPLAKFSIFQKYLLHSLNHFHI